jgi:hypothetical protein
MSEEKNVVELVAAATVEIQRMVDALKARLGDSVKHIMVSNCGDNHPSIRVTPVIDMSIEGSSGLSRQFEGSSEIRSVSVY